MVKCGCLFGNKLRIIMFFVELENSLFKEDCPWCLNIDIMKLNQGIIIYKIKYEKGFSWISEKE